MNVADIDLFNGTAQFVNAFLWHKPKLTAETWKMQCVMEKLHNTTLVENFVVCMMIIYQKPINFYLQYN